MDHIAIMKKSWGFIEKIFTGQKKIESRWYKTKRAPWGRIQHGEMVYFKNSGELVLAKAEVENVLQFSDLTPRRVKSILTKYAELDGIKKEQISNFYELFKDKHYCMLIFLKNPQKIKPFQINKKGFGLMSAWICVGDINNVRMK